MPSLAAFAARNPSTYRRPTQLAVEAAINIAVKRLFELSQRADRGEYGLKGSVTFAYTHDNEMVGAAFDALHNALGDLAQAIGGESATDLCEAQDALVKRFWANCDAVEDAGPNDLAEIGATSRIGGAL